MKPTELPTFLYDRRVPPGVVVDAVLARDVPADIVAHIEMLWKTARWHLPPETEHRHWDWSLKGEAIESNQLRILTVSCWGSVQGMAAVESTPRIDSSGLPALYLGYLEAAPWNLPSMITGRLKMLHGVGTALIAGAIRMSQELGCSGRIGLHSLPSSESFYLDQLHMRLGNPETMYEGMRFFEYDALGAEEFLRRTGL